MKKVYLQRAERFEKEMKDVQRKSQWFSVSRLVTIILALVSAYFLLDGGQKIWLVLALSGVFGFFVLVWRHVGIRKQKKRVENLLLLNQKETAYLEGKDMDFPDGDEFNDPGHLFSYDLDIFGPHSLFYHLNRTATLKGRQRLARALSEPDPADKIPEKQEAVQELITDLDWRQNFTAAGMEVEEDPHLSQKIKIWLASSKNRPPALLLHPLTRVVLAVITIGLGVHFAVFPAPAHFNWFMYGFGLNLLLVFSQYKYIKKEYSMLNGIASSLHMYGELIGAVEQRSFRAGLLKSLQSQLVTEDEKASRALKKMGRLLDGFDQMNNAVALLLTNGLYLYHLHVLRGLYQWKETYGSQVEVWLRSVSEMDHLVSLANFAFNYQEYTYPEITEEVAFEATQIGHPLIERSKRVNNSISLDNFKYVVLTGSNMSGKSTFLKTMGINLVLARAGAPVCAEKFKTHAFTLLTSMKLIDSLAREESYFQAEVLRLKKVREILEEGRPCLVLLDEILRGTNSDDKRNGTRLFMQKIAGFNARGVIATHDIDIADLAQKQAGTFKAFYFESKVQNDQLYFDYYLREGICTTPNATDLMRAHGII